MLADAASARENLGFILGGGIDTFAAMLLPPGMPPAVPGQIATSITSSIVFRLLFTRGEMGRMHSFEVKTSDADGAEVVKIQANMFVPPNPQLAAGWDQPLVMALTMQVHPLKWGNYSVDIFGDGAHLKSIPFRIVQVSPPGMPGAPGSPRL